MTDPTKMRAAYLFARPSLLGGVASLLDFGGTLTEYNTANTPAQADTLALWSDWLAVGDDMWAAIETYDGTLPKHQRLRRPAAKPN